MRTMWWGADSGVADDCVCSCSSFLNSPELLFILFIHYFVSSIIHVHLVSWVMLVIYCQVLHNVCGRGWEVLGGAFTLLLNKQFWVSAELWYFCLARAWAWLASMHLSYPWYREWHAVQENWLELKCLRGMQPPMIAWSGSEYSVWLIVLSIRIFSDRRSALRCIEELLETGITDSQLLQAVSAYLLVRWVTILTFQGGINQTHSYVLIGRGRYVGKFGSAKIQSIREIVYAFILWEISDAMVRLSQWYFWMIIYIKMTRSLPPQSYNYSHTCHTVSTAMIS